MPLYGTAEYWEDHYANDDDETYDWLPPFKAKVLVGGVRWNNVPWTEESTRGAYCWVRKAMLSERMYDAGWKTIHAIDVSNTVIRHMKGRQVVRKSGKRLRKRLDL